MKPIARIRMVGDGAISGDTYGGKAKGLGVLAEGGLPIPPTLCFPCGISTDELEVWAALPNGLEELGVSGACGLIVRSSGRKEDSSTASLAGHFESTRTPCDAKAVIEAARHVIRSGIEHGVAQEDVGFVVQPWVPASCAGVLFSCDPVTGLRDEAVCMLVDGNASELVGGLHHGSATIRLPRGSNATNLEDFDFTGVPAAFSHDVLASLSDAADALELRTGGPVDVEWCVAAETDELLFVQCRPLTGLAPREKGLVKVGLGRTVDAIARTHDKVALRLVAEAAGVAMAPAYVYSPAAGSALDLDGLSPSSACCYSVVVIHPRVVGGRVLRQFASWEGLFDTISAVRERALETCWRPVILIQEIYPAVLTGIALPDKGGWVIEIGFGHFIPKGLSTVSTYHIDSNGVIMAVIERLQSEEYVFTETAEAVEVSIEPPKAPRLSVDAAHYIASKFPAIADRYPGCAIEFGIHESDGEPYIIDVSGMALEDSPPGSFPGVISPGTVTGRFVDVSARSSVDFDQHLMDVRAFAGDGGENIVYGALSPDIGLLDLIATCSAKTVAFVFVHGMLLAHLPIVLRERGVPAVEFDWRGRIAAGSIVEVDALSPDLPAAERIRVVG